MEKYRIEVKKNNNELHILIYEDERLVEIYKENVDKMRLEGNIYVGTVKDIVKGMQAAFIDIGEEKNALIHIKDLVEKESLSTGNVNLDVEKYEIQKLLKVGEKVLVQIKRDCDDQKGSRVTKDIKLTGKYSVFMPYAKFVTVSSKITSEEEKKRLIKIGEDGLKEYIKDTLKTSNSDDSSNDIKENSIDNINDKFGLIIRTSAEGKDDKLIIKDIKLLIEKWEEIQQKANEFINSNISGVKDNSGSQAKLRITKSDKVDNNSSKLIYNNNGILGKLIIDFEAVGLEIFTDNEETKQYILEKLGKTDEEISIKIKDIKDIPEMPRKIWLRCGGFITIDKCEALTAIDVNSGKFTGNSNIEDTVLKVNLEATEEIARQIRLRDIGGIIIVDYIDMNEEQDREKVKEAMQMAIKKDRSKVQVLEFTNLGLLEITRKHILGR